MQLPARDVVPNRVTSGVVSGRIRDANLDGRRSSWTGWTASARRGAGNRAARRHHLADHPPVLPEHRHRYGLRLFSSYEALDGALLGGFVDVAWNAPLAPAQTLILSGGAWRALAMRDTDRQVATVVLVKAGGPVESLNDLRGRRVALGLRTSSELDLIPRHQLRQHGLDIERKCEMTELESNE